LPRIERVPDEPVFVAMHVVAFGGQAESSRMPVQPVVPGFITMSMVVDAARSRR
jgi:hypothetical protein